MYFLDFIKKTSGLGFSSRSRVCLGQTLPSLELVRINPLPDMPILGLSNSAASKDMTSKIWTSGDTII